MPYPTPSSPTKIGATVTTTALTARIESLWVDSARNDCMIRAPPSTMRDLIPSVRKVFRRAGMWILPVKHTPWSVCLQGRMKSTIIHHPHRQSQVLAEGEITNAMVRHKRSPWLPLIQMGIFHPLWYLRTISANARRKIQRTFRLIKSGSLRRSDPTILQTRLVS